LGDTLIALAEQAYGLRQLDRLEGLTQALLGLPLPGQYRSAGRYFQGVELIRRGDPEAAKSVLEGVASEPSHRYSARAIQSLGAIYKNCGDLESALKIHIEAGRCAAERGRVDLLTGLFVQRNVAVLKSMHGDHRGALEDLEQISPLAVGCLIHAAYYDYLNSAAVELGEVGRLNEAARASRIVISTSFADAYPEWRQTFDEITSRGRRASHSMVAVRQPIVKTGSVQEPVGESHNLVRLPLTERSTLETLVPTSRGARARILDFQGWKTTIKPSGVSPSDWIPSEQRSGMTTGQKMIRLMDLISRDETDDDTIDRILKPEEIVPNPRSEKKLD
jgi:hypothetical protein